MMFYPNCGPAYRPIFLAQRRRALRTKIAATLAITGALAAFLWVVS